MKSALALLSIVILLFANDVSAAPVARSPTELAQNSNELASQVIGALSPSQSLRSKATLYEEVGEGSNAFSGNVSWRAEPDERAHPSMLVRGLVEVPDRGFKLLLTLRRNADPNLPASHTIELLLEVRAGFPAGGIADVLGLLMKPAEPARGVALAVISARVQSGYFLVNLSSAEADRQRNIEMLRDRTWIDLRFVYDNGQRAILTLEKGLVGEQSFAAALKSWEMPVPGAQEIR